MTRKTVIYIRAEPEVAKKQLKELQQFCVTQNWDVFHEYLDIQIPENKEPLREWHRLFKDIPLKQFDLVLFYDVASFSWKSFEFFMQKLQQLKNHDVHWCSYKEPIFSSIGIHADMMHSYLYILSSIKSGKHSKATRDGIQKAKNHGILVGRPSIPLETEMEIIRLRHAGYSFSQIQQTVTYIDSHGQTRHPSKATISKILKKHLSVFEKGGGIKNVR